MKDRMDEGDRRIDGRFDELKRWGDMMGRSNGSSSLRWGSVINHFN